MPLLGGLFTRGSASSNNASKSKNSLDPSSQAYSSSQTVQSQPTGSSSHPSSSQQSSSQASPTAEYVSFIPGPGPSSPNGRGLAYAGEPQKDRRGLGFFGRKRSTNAMSNNNAYDNGNGPGGMLDVFANDSRGPRPSYLSRLSTSSDVPPSSGSATSPRSLRPPPQGMFSTSTRSLPPPQPSHSMSHSSSGLSSQQQYTSSLSPLSPSISPTKSTASGWTTRSGATTKTSKSTGAKAGRKFAFWARSSKSPSPVPPSPTSRDYDDSRGGEFNLRAFRHVQAEPSSPAPSNGKSKNGGKNGNKGKNAPLTATNLSSLGREYDSGGEMQRPPPRPRGTSDASSRISVAAFREVHARRSLAGSPAPGDGPGPARAPSPGPGMYNLNNGSGRQHVPQSPGPRPPSKSGNNNKKKESGHQRTNNQWESESDEEEEEESESDEGRGAGTTRRKRTVRRAAKSEAGHGAGGHGGAKQSTLGVYGMMGPSVSAGNVNVGVTSKRLSQGTLPPIQQKQTSPQPRPQRAQMPPQQQQKPRQHSTSASSSDSGSEDSDDAPLATLVAPRRPGSSLSLASNSSRGNGNGSNVNLVMGSHPNLHSNSNLVPHSPLAPHNTGGSSNASKGQPNKPKPLIDIAALTASRPAVFSQKERDGDGFTGTGMLAGGASRGAGAPASPSTSAAASPVLTSRSPPVTNTGLVHFPSPPGSPVAETPPRVAGLGRVLGGALTGAGVSSRALKDEAPKRSSPMRRETASSAASLGATRTTTSTSPSTSPAVSPVSAPKRDVLSERLRAVAAANSEKERQERLQRSPPPSFSSVTARKAFHRRSSSDIVSATARTWGAEDDKDKDGDEDLGRDLAEMLGGGISLLSRAGEMSPPRISSTDAVAALGGDWEKKEAEAKEEGEKDKDSIAPIVIKQRSPPPAFSVTSRPSHQAHQQTRSVSAYGDLGIRQRSSTMVPVSTPSTFGGSNRSATSNSNSNSNSTSHANSTAGSAATSSTSGSVANDARSSTSPGTGLRARQRSSTMMPLGSGSVVSTPSPPATVSPPSMLNNPPTRPFAAPRMERNSPASSTGDSSSGPVPLTPRDGSDFGSGGSGSVKEEREGWSGGVSGLVPVGASGRKMHHQRRSVSFDFEEEVSGDGKGKAKAKAKPRETPVQEEERRRERRRSEARAAIELGNVINGRGPIADEDEDDDVPINQTRMNTMGNMGMSTMGSPMGMGMSPMNNMMGMNMPMGFNNSAPTMSPGWPAWQQQQQQGSPGMLSPAQFMVPPPADPNFYAAHQQAMMIAKQAYQMAVAQQAMAAAGDEWERGSSVGGFAGRGSVYGGSTVGGPAPSVMGSSYGMGMGMQNSGMGGWSSPGGGMFPPAPRSMYGGGGARSEYGGGGGGGGGWNSSRSVYGETFGPSPERYSRTVSSGNLAAPAKQTTRESGYFPPVPAVPQGQSGRPGPGNPRQRTASQPASPSRGAVARRTPPPSSWKAS